MTAQNLKVADIARHIGARIVCEGTTDDSVNAGISGLASIATARAGELTHLSNAAYRAHLASTQATAVIVREADAANCPGIALVVDDPYLAFARASQLFKSAAHLAEGVDPSAVIGDGCQIDATARIGPYVVVGRDTLVGPRVELHPHTVVGERCRLEADVQLQANVTLYSDVKVGARSVIHSGTVIGADGFGFTVDEQYHWQEIAQLGGVTIGADVSIGSSTTIDCGAIDDTVIEDGVKIDNQVQIGHNCRIGAHSLICGNVGMAGSTIVGKHCVFGGGSGAGGDKPVEICDGVQVAQSTVITQSVNEPGVYSGTILFDNHQRWRRNALRFSSLNDLFKRVKKLEQRFSKS